MNEFERQFNELIVETFHLILKEEMLFVKELTGYDVSAREIHLIEHVAKLSGMATAGDLAESLQVTPASVTMMLTKLEGQGYLVKRRDEQDARAIRLSLTDKGSEIDNRHTEFHRNMVVRMTQEFTEFERDILAGAVKRLNAFFKSK